MGMFVIHMNNIRLMNIVYYIIIVIYLNNCYFKSQIKLRTMSAGHAYYCKLCIWDLYISIQRKNIKIIGLCIFIMISVNNCLIH